MDTLLLLVALIITLGAQGYVTSTYNKFNKIANKKQITGFEVARMILDGYGMNNVYVTETKGVLSDHYDSSRKVVRLSTEIFHGKSLASCAVAAHEVGHAIQDKTGYSFLKFRSLMFPIVNFASYAGYFAILIGIIFGTLNLIWIGIAMEIIILIFQLITLPVEFDASKRALEELKNKSILTDSELKQSSTMLKAAALTYVATVVNTILQILRLLLIFGQSDRK